MCVREERTSSPQQHGGTSWYSTTPHTARERRPTQAGPLRSNLLSCHGEATGKRLGASRSRPVGRRCGMSRFRFDGGRLLRAATTDKRGFLLWPGRSERTSRSSAMSPTGWPSTEAVAGPKARIWRGPFQATERFFSRGASFADPGALNTSFGPYCSRAVVDPSQSSGFSRDSSVTGAVTRPSAWPKLRAIAAWLPRRRSQHPQFWLLSSMK